MHISLTSMHVLVYRNFKGYDSAHARAIREMIQAYFPTTVLTASRVDEPWFIRQREASSLDTHHVYGFHQTSQKLSTMSNLRSVDQNLIVRLWIREGLREPASWQRKPTNLRFRIYVSDK